MTRYCRYPCLVFSVVLRLCSFAEPRPVVLGLPLQPPATGGKATSDECRSRPEEAGLSVGHRVAICYFDIFHRLKLRSFGVFMKWRYSSRALGEDMAESKGMG